jgi:hypothetical protein
MNVQVFNFKLKDLPAKLPSDWEPFAVESDPGLGVVWIWARRP